MPIYRLPPEPVFPDPDLAEPEGLLAVGGDLSPRRLVNAYAAGIFPWYDEDSPILWWSPPERAVWRPGSLRLSRTTLRRLRQHPFEVTFDTAFGDVVRACAEIPRPDQDGTWILPEMVAAYERLHALGYAHSAEAWRGGRLVGGIYGVSLGGAFFGESMFTREPEASRAAFRALDALLQAWGFTLVDGQLPNDNVLGLGAEVVPRAEFRRRLEEALELPTRRGPWTSEGRPSNAEDTEKSGR